MAKYITLAAQPRTVTGKKVAGLRRDGWLPAIIYGHRTEPCAVSVAEKELDRVVSAAGTSHLVEIRVDGEAKPRMALVRAVQRHVTRHSIIHTDFIQVRMDEAVRSEVPIVITGQPALASHHEGVLDIQLTSLHVSALPGDLPAEIVIDVDHLEHFGDGVMVGDLELGGEVQILNNPDDSIVRLVPVSRAVAHDVEDREEVEGEEAAEPGERAEGRAGEED